MIWVVDQSSALNDEDRQVFSLVCDKPCVPALNKSDLPEAITVESIQSLFSGAGLPCPAPVGTSAVTDEGVAELERRISEILLGDPDDAAGEGALVSNIRHLDALQSAQAALSDAVALLECGESLEFVMVDLKTALDSIGAILGIDVGEEILDRIFQKFCLGK